MTRYYPMAPAIVRHATGVCLYGWHLGGLAIGQTVYPYQTEGA